MHRIVLLSLLLLNLAFSIAGKSQKVSLNPDTLLLTQGEVYFRFTIQNPDQVRYISRIISVDKIVGDDVYAYANRSGFAQFRSTAIPYTVLTPPSMMLSPEELHPDQVPKDSQGKTIWNFYPTYDEYLSFMNEFALNYPDICHLDTLGASIQGRLILALKISDNVLEDDPEPQFLYTSSIHGDEVTAYVLMLHLIDYLLGNYGTDPRVTDIINNTEIYINPLANPDGTYHGGNNTVYGATRYNANDIDLNRNYPDPKDGPHPDGNPWQIETEVFMGYADTMHFILGANFHGGAEVFNYPWDTWPRLHTDDAWWQFTGREWADTVHKYAPSGYFTDLQNGITNGYAWYTVSGGRQDYMNYWHSCREVTLEISNIKTLPVAQLINYWNYNYHSFLNYIEQSNYGFNGIVTDTVTGEPLEAKVFIFNHDLDGSYVYSRLPHGFYARPIQEGDWDVTFSSPGYITKNVHVSVSQWNTARVDVQLRKINYYQEEISSAGIRMNPNPSNGWLQLTVPASSGQKSEITVFNLQGCPVFSTCILVSGKEESISLDLSDLPAGLYFIQISGINQTFTEKLVIRK